MHSTKDAILMVDLTIADILKLDIFKDASVHSDTDGLANVVTGITTADDPDLIQWLKGGELLIASIKITNIIHTRLKIISAIFSRKKSVRLLSKFQNRKLTF